MLVLSRRPQEEIVFPELGITVEVNRISGNRVRLGITAPDEVRIVRGELAFEEPDSKAKAADSGGRHRGLAVVSSMASPTSATVEAG